MHGFIIGNLDSAAAALSYPPPCSPATAREGKSIQVVSFRHSGQRRVIAGLAAAFQYLDKAATIPRRFADQIKKVRFRHMVRAAGSDQDAFRLQKFQRPAG